MTMPHLSNCEHSETHWCLDCVKELGEERLEALHQRDALAFGILNAAYAAGIFNTETSLTGLSGPQLLLLCKELGGAFVAGKSQGKESC